MSPLFPFYSPISIPENRLSGPREGSSPSQERGVIHSCVSLRIVDIWSFFFRESSLVQSVLHLEPERSEVFTLFI